MGFSKKTYKYILDVNKTKPLSNQEQILLLKRAKKGDIKARNLLIESNLKLISKIAFKYKFDFLTYDDIVSEGVFGFEHAIYNFDINKKAKFTTYASYRIKESISKAILNKNDTIRIPNDMYKKFKKEGHNLPWDVCKYIEYKNSHRSLDEKADERHLRSEIIPDRYVENPEHSVKDKDLIYNLTKKSLSKLNEIEKKVIEGTFGFNREKITLNEISKDLNISIHNIKSIKKQAIEKLRHDYEYEINKEKFIDFIETDLSETR